jgi:3-methyl-2-oxobutanoate hydroxymethyltransferase
MKPVTTRTLQQKKMAQEKFAVVAAYDATFASTLCEAGVDVILVGDSLGMVLQGHDSTLPVTIDNMAYHTQCVKRGNQGALIIADMPFMSYASTEQALHNAAILMKAGAHMVKLEGGDNLADTVRQLVLNGIPVCAHLGLTPQSVNTLGGYRVQGREPEQAEKIISEAKTLQDSGASMLVLECVPTALGQAASEALSIPVIGIGAGAGTDAQVLVLHDMLGLNPRPAKFVRNFMLDQTSIQSAINSYVCAVKDGSFPAAEHTFN